MYCYLFLLYADTLKRLTLIELTTMSYWLRTLPNNIKIVKSDAGYRVLGVRTRVFLAELRRTFRTTRFKLGMFRDITSTSFEISRFFLYDLYEILIYLRNNGTAHYNQRMVEKLINEIEQTDEISRVKRNFPSKLDYDKLSRFKFSPLPHQNEFFKNYDLNTQRYSLNGYILAAVPGSGKTLTSLMTMAMRKKDIVFVFSPKNALDEVWRSTISEIKDAKVWVYPDPIVDNDYTHYVFNHENTNFALNEIKTILKKRPRDEIGIIVDECHKFTELSAALTNNLIDICRMSKSEDIIFMSGTPFKALGIELLPFLMSVDPKFTPDDVAGFKKIASVSGPEAKGIVAARIGKLLYRVEKSQVVNNEVNNYVVKVKVKNSDRFLMTSIRERMKEFIKDRNKYYAENKQKLENQYLEIIERFSKTPEAKRNPTDFETYKYHVALIRESGDYIRYALEIKETNKYENKVIIPTLSSSDKIIFRDVKTVYKYLPLKIQGEALGLVLGKARTECNLAIAENIDNGVIYSDNPEFNGIPWQLADIFATSKTKTVMFTDFVEVLRYMNGHLTKEGYHPEVIYADTNKDLYEIIRRFENDSRVNPLVATYKSLSTAVPLVMADTCVLLNVPFRDYIYQQTTARVDRLGQKHPIHIYQYQLDTGGIPNISTRSNDILQWSRRMVEELMGTELNEDYEELEDEIVFAISKDTKNTGLSLTKFWSR